MRLNKIQKGKVVPNHIRSGKAFFIILIICLLLPLTQSSYACSPAPNGHVFADTIEMDSQALPSGLAFSHVSLYLMTFINTGTDTVYVLADPALLRDSWPVVDAPTDIASLVPQGQVIAFALDPSEDFELRRSDAFFPGFDPDQYFDYDSPELFEGLPVPDPLETQIVMISDGEVYDIPVTITYAPNPDYDPEGFAKGVEACAQINETAERTSQVAGAAMALPVIAIAVCGVLVALGGGVGVVIFLMRRRT